MRSAPATGASVDRLTRLVTGLLEPVVVVLFGVLCCLVFGEVIARYAFNRPHAWSEELIIYLFTWVSFLGAALALRSGRHVSISCVVDRLSPRGRAAWDCVGNLIVLLFLVFLFVQGVRFVSMSHTLSSIVLQIPLSWVSVSLVIMAVVMALYAADMLHGACRRWRRPTETGTAAETAASERVV